MNGATNLPDRPMSLEEITERANEFMWNPSIAFKFWLRAAETIFSESQVYLRERNFAQAYLLLMRYTVLVINHLNEHPDVKDPSHRRAVRQCQKRLPTVMDQMEALKPGLKEAYEEWARMRAIQQEQEGSRRGGDSPTIRDPALSWNHVAQADLLDAGQHQELAVDLASKEIRRRREHVLSDEEQQRRRTGGVWEGWDDAFQRPSARDQVDDDLQSQMRAARRTLDGEMRPPEVPGPSRPSSNGTSLYRYPSIAKSTPLAYERRPDPMNDPLARARSVRPPIPPKKLELRSFSPPQRPRKEPLPEYELPTPPEYEVDSRPVIPPKREATPEAKVTFKPAGYLENGDPVRPVFLPSKLREKFLEIAAPNTRKNLEMCGILCGTAVNNALFISCLLIPEQKCTSDTCETENETAMLDFCMSKDLLIFGWIHTHPTQTCFMSSRDLHTQAGYQVMMPESIAIVCAPKDNPSWGIFRLTQPPGLPYILQCNASDTFHQHTIDNIYTSAMHPPGHVYTTDSLPFEIEDLRPRK